MPQKPPYFPFYVRDFVSDGKEGAMTVPRKTTKKKSEQEQEEAAERKPTYSELLKDPRWQRLRLEIFSRDDWACRFCGEKTKMLAVHHVEYIRGKKPWEYEPRYLLTLCDDCHQSEFENRKSSEELLLNVLRLTGFSWRDIDGLACDIYTVPPDCNIEAFCNALCRIIRTPRLRDELIESWVSAHPLPPPVEGTDRE